MGKLRGAALDRHPISALLPAAASAHTKVVYAGGPAPWASTLGIARGRQLPHQPGDDQYGDTVVWNGASLSAGFHTVDLPALGGADLPLIVPTGSTVSAEPTTPRGTPSGSTASRC